MTERSIAHASGPESLPAESGSGDSHRSPARRRPPRISGRRARSVLAPKEHPIHWRLGQHDENKRTALLGADEALLLGTAHRIGT